MAGVVLFPSFPAAMFSLFLEYVFAENWFGPTMSIIQSELPLNAVGLGASLNVLLTTCVRGHVCACVTQPFSG